MLGMLVFIALVAAFVHLSTRRDARHAQPGALATNLAFLFMGLAFLLLETKSVIVSTGARPINPFGL